jgi:arylsulfatase A-like enzyme
MPRSLLYSLLLGIFSALNATAQAAQPNVLFIAVDDLRPELRCYGETHMVTPNIDRLAASGRLFRNHYVAVPTCGASRYAMLTGRRPTPASASVSNNAFDLLGGNPETWAHLLRNNGWRTVSLGKITHEPDGFRWVVNSSLGGDDRGRIRVGSAEAGLSWDEILFDHGRWGARNNPLFNYASGSGRTSGVSPAYEIGVDGSGASVPDETYQDGRIAEVAIEKLREFKDDQTTFCLAVGFYRPHLPFNCPKAYYDLYDPATLPEPFPLAKPAGAETSTTNQSGELSNYGHGFYPGDPGTHTDDAYRRKLRRAYFASVSYGDAQIGKVLDALEALGLAQNTIVVLWGDHGWQLDDYDLLGKHTCLERSLHAPLIIRAPEMSFRGVPAAGLVESIDIYPTLVQLCGLARPAGIDGASLVPLLNNPDSPGKGWTYSAFEGNEESVRTSRWRLVASGSVPAYDLYDLETTPFELTDVSASEGAVLSDLANNKLHTQATRSGTTTFGAWQQSHFTPEEILDPGIAGFAANPDADHQANVFEYLGETAPRNPSSTWISSSEIADLTAFGLQGQWLTFRFRASSAIDDLRLLPQFSTDLVTWSAFDPVYLDKLILSPTLNEYLFRPSIPISPTLSRGFWRLKVVLQP